MANQTRAFTLINSYGEEIATINGTDAEIKKAIIVLGEFLLRDEDLKAENVSTLTAIGEYLWEQGKAASEDLAQAKKFFEAAEKFGDPQASDCLACLQENPLISAAMWLRAAERNAPSPVNNLQDEYGEQAIYWRKKIAEVEGKSFDEDAPTDEEILQAECMKFFAVYRRAFNGELDAMKTCLEFCEEEKKYWDERA